MRDFVLGAAAIAVLLASGCDGGLGVRDGGPSDGEARLWAAHAYVLAVLHAEAPDPLQGYGFDLDGHDGNPPGAPVGGCQDRPDLTSAATGIAGIDDQFAGLAPSLDGVIGGDGLDGALRDRIASGALLVIVEVGDVNSFTNDSAVQVRVVLGAPAAGGAPGASLACPMNVDRASCVADTQNGCAWSETRTACTGIAAGQTYSVVTELGTATGTITNGRLESTVASLPITFMVSRRTVAFTLHDVGLRGRITATNLSGGELGGTLSTADLTRLVDDAGLADLGPTTFVAPDLMPNADGSACGAYSVGMGIEGVSATLN